MEQALVELFFAIGTSLSDASYLFYLFFDNQREVDDNRHIQFLILVSSSPSPITEKIHSIILLLHVIEKKWVSIIHRHLYMLQNVQRGNRIEIFSTTQYSSENLPLTRGFMECAYNSNRINTTFGNTRVPSKKHIHIPVFRHFFLLLQIQFTKKRFLMYSIV